MSELREALSKPPFDILVNPWALRGKKPWEIDIIGLLERFIHLLEESAKVDLRVAGSAALSSALIYRLKVETLFLFERLRAQRRLTDTTEPPTLLSMPFRYDIPTTSLEDLLTTLERIIQEITAEPAVEGPRLDMVETRPIVETDPFFGRIQELVVSLKNRLNTALAKTGELLLSEFFQGMNIVGKARSFILLLFVATERLIDLEQVEDDIKIVVVKTDVTRPT